MRVARASAASRAFVRIRIYRIGGIFRISFAYLAISAITVNPAKPSADKCPLVKDARARRILKIL